MSPDIYLRSGPGASPHQASGPSFCRKVGSVLEYDKVTVNDILRIVDKGAPGFAERMAFVRITEVRDHGVTVQLEDGQAREFNWDCAERLQKTPWTAAFPTDEQVEQASEARQL